MRSVFAIAVIATFCSQQQQLVNADIHGNHKHQSNISLTPKKLHLDHVKSVAFQQRNANKRSILDEKYKDISVSRGGGIVDSVLDQETLGVGFFIVVDHVLRQIFKKQNIAFPSQLAGCLILFALMVVSNIISPGSGDFVFNALTPGAGWLAKWLPVMFVPGLVMIPIAPSVGSSVELLKIAFIICGGFFFTLISTAYSVIGVRSLQGSLIKDFPNNADSNSESGADAVAAKPYSEAMVKQLATTAAVTGILAVAPISFIQDSSLKTPITSISYMAGTLLGFVWGARLSPSITKVVHPLVTSASVALIQAKIFGLITGSNIQDMVRIYKSGSMMWNEIGAGDLLLYALGPAVFSLAIAMYSRKNLMADNLAVVITGAIVSSTGGVFSTAFAARLLKIANSVVRRSVISRNVTTPLAIAMTTLLEGDIPIACVVVVLTGIFGVSAGAATMNKLGIADPLARGLAMGAGAQGVGVASMANEKDAFPFAAINMVMTAVLGTVLISIPVVRDQVIKIISTN